MLTGSYLWLLDVCVPLPGAPPMAPPLLFGASVSHTVYLTLSSAQRTYILRSGERRCKTRRSASLWLKACPRPFPEPSLCGA